jgi:hypothetical protein
MRNITIVAVTLRHLNLRLVLRISGSCQDLEAVREFQQNQLGVTVSIVNKRTAQIKSTKDLFKK